MSLVYGSSIRRNEKDDLPCMAETMTVVFRKKTKNENVAANSEASNVKQILMIIMNDCRFGNLIMNDTLAS